jgi:hypothetical protein
MLVIGQVKMKGAINLATCNRPDGYTTGHIRRLLLLRAKHLLKSAKGVRRAHAGPVL